MRFPIPLSGAKVATLIGNREVAGRPLARQIIGGKYVEILCEFVEIISVVVSKPPAKLAILGNEPGVLRRAFLTKNLFGVSVYSCRYFKSSLFFA